MKKSILAVALLGGLAGVACAQSGVVVYGIIDMSVTRENNGAAAGSVVRMDSGQLYGSRLGFKGSEDLGGGMSVNFNLENGFNADTGTLGQGGLLFGRQAWVGISGGAGSVRFGRMWSPYYTALFDIDPFGDGTVGAASYLMSGAGFRRSNTVDYMSPSFGGLSGEFAYSFGEVPGSLADNRVIDAKAVFERGPLHVEAAYFNQNNTGAVGGASKSALLGGVYDFGAAKLHLAYDWNKSDTSAATVADNRDLMVGTTVPIGAGSLVATYIRKYDKLVSNADSTRVSVGYLYNLSKRTILYTALAHNTNDSGARYNLDDSAKAGASASAFQIGIDHSF